MVGAPDDLLAITREERAAVVSRVCGDAGFARAIGLHGPQVEVAAALGGVENRVGLPVDGRLCVVAVRVRQALLDLAVVGSQEDVVSGKDRPHVAFAAVGRRRALRRPFVRRAVDKVLVVLEKVRARRPSLACGDQLLVRTVGIHQKDLVALVRRRAWTGKSAASHLAPNTPRRSGRRASTASGSSGACLPGAFGPSPPARRKAIVRLASIQDFLPSKRSRPSTSARIFRSATLRWSIQKPQSGWMK